MEERDRDRRPLERVPSLPGEVPQDPLLGTPCRCALGARDGVLLRCDHAHATLREGASRCHQRHTTGLPYPTEP
jgi:hypothetical protein